MLGRLWESYWSQYYGRAQLDHYIAHRIDCGQVLPKIQIGYSSDSLVRIPKVVQRCHERLYLSSKGVSVRLLTVRGE